MDVYQMICPTCGYKKTSVRMSPGFTQLIIEECPNCDTVYMVDNSKIKILFRRNDNDKYYKSN